MEYPVLCNLPGSKSHTNRALIMAILTREPVWIKNPLYSQDTKAMIEAIKTLGIRIATKPEEILVEGDIGEVQEKYFFLDAKDSGTTSRFLLPLLCTLPGKKTLSGSEGLQRRPIGDLVDALRRAGAILHYEKEEGKLPVTVLSSSLSADTIDVRSDSSSQFCSALLLIAPYFQKGITLRPGKTILSEPYLRMTRKEMEKGGIDVRVNKKGEYVVMPHQKYTRTTYEIEGDFSGAGYFFGASCLLEKPVLLHNLSEESVHPDKRFPEILCQSGSSISYLPEGILFEGKPMPPLMIDMQDCPDQIMTMAVLAAFSRGVSVLSGIRSLRIKECNRVSALITELGKMGIPTKEEENSLTIFGGNPRPARIQTYNDHRIAMSFALAKLRLPETKISDPEVVDKTFPNFWEEFGRFFGSSGKGRNV